MKLFNVTLVLLGLVGLGCEQAKAGEAEASLAPAVVASPPAAPAPAEPAAAPATVRAPQGIEALRAAEIPADANLVRPPHKALAAAAGTVAGSSPPPDAKPQAEPRQLSKLSRATKKSSSVASF
jgi:hypothetical protein